MIINSGFIKSLSKVYSVYKISLLKNFFVPDTGLTFKTKEIEVKDVNDKTTTPYLRGFLPVEVKGPTRDCAVVER